MVPPLTDVGETLGQYHSLFNALGIPVDSPFQVTAGFTHPLPEVNQTLTRQFFETKMAIENLKMFRTGVRWINSRVQNTTITFVFEYNE